MGFDFATAAGMLPSMVWLLFVSFSLGYALIREKSLMSFGFGLAAFTVLSILFNLVQIPLTWPVFAALSVASWGYLFYKKDPIFSDLASGFKLQMPERDVLLVIAMFLAYFLVLWAGSNAYPYLEDDDPWTHATGAKIISMTGSFTRFFDGTHFTRLYIEPYPPGYDILMGVLHQLTVSVSDTLKFFNAFLIGASLIFAFYAIAQITNDRRLALLSTFFLLCLPSFMGHFIWAQTLAVLFVFVAFYGFDRSLTDKRFMLPSAVAAAAIAVTQPSTAAIFAMMFIIYAAVKVFISGSDAANRLKTLIIPALIALVLAGTFYVPTFQKYGVNNTLVGIGAYDSQLFLGQNTADTSGGIVYSLEDFLFAKDTGKIDQHIGIGMVLGILAMAGLVFLVQQRAGWKSNSWMLLVALWLVFCFLGTEGNALPVKLFPHRFWVFLSIPVAMAAAYGYTHIEALTQHKKAALAMLVVLVLLTSADAKIKVQTSVWPPGMDFTSQEELGGYISMKEQLPKNTLIFPLCSSDSKLIGSDMLSEPYVPEYEAFKRDALNKTPSEVYTFLRSRGYVYMVVDSTCFTTLGQEKALMLFQGFEALGKFQVVSSNGGFALLKVI
jgi:hypothetical protein